MRAGESVTVIHIWNTTSFEKGSYAIAAGGELLPEETATLDVTLTCPVMVTIAGDVNGDKFANAKDSVTLGMAFGTTIGNQSWAANADINSDDWVNGKDAAILGLNFNQTWS